MSIVVEVVIIIAFFQFWKSVIFSIHISNWHIKYFLDIHL